MHISGEMMWKYFCLCAVVVMVYGKGRPGRDTRIRKHAGLDLLKNCPLSSNKHEVQKLGTDQGQTFSDADSTDINYLKLNKVLRKRTKAVTVEFVGYSTKKSYSTLFGIYLKHKPLPLVEISLDIHHRKAVLRYQGVRSFQRVNVTFGKELENWNVLSAEVNKTHFTVTVACSVVRSVKLRQRMEKITRKAIGTLASDKFGKNRFMGQLFEGRFYPQPSKKKSLLCSKPVTLQQDEGYVKDGAVNGDRILLLEQQITQLNNMVHSLKMQNSNLTGRVVGLESCSHCSPGCQWEGQMFEEGQTWSQGKCTVCICKNGQADCLERTDIPSCQIPCTTNPCQNQGQCLSLEDTLPTLEPSFQCMCQPPYDGQYCEHKENPCVWPRESGICDQNLPRFYYDMDIQQCLPFNYTGCGGNINNYETLDECQAVAVKGACCFRQYSLNVQDVIVSAQKETFGCKEISLSECQSTHRQVIGDTKVEVISFYPGVDCAAADCGRAQEVDSCLLDGRSYEIGEKANLGCQVCTCESSGQFVCSCSQKAVRKEIRDLTPEELARFQAALQQLRLVGPGNPWEEFRDIYMTHTMHSNGGPYFLPWHRLFLRKLEQKLQEIDCSITLPYYDFATDVGNFSQSILWQPGFFGGNGIDDCVVDHPFGLPGSWRPCIRRNFNPDVKLPTLVEMSLALASEDYTEMSMCLEAFVSYIHTYIGGDMATRAASYDPVFYSVHAYVDMLYWWWQQKGSNKFKYPAVFANIPMVPFNIPPSAILDLEADLCVTYMDPAKGNPCNRTTPGGGGKGPIRGDVAPQGDTTFVGGFNSLGYNKKGFDRMGFSQEGYMENGYNRDGYNKIGYDIYGYDRYGYDKDGYSPYGYDNEGWDRDGVQDLSGRYDNRGLDMNCLNIRGLTTEGYDKYGYNMRGYDATNCNYFYNGPFATIQSRKIWAILREQPKSFLMSLSRTCPGMEPLPRNWLQQYWITDIKDVTAMLPVTSNTNSDQLNSARFCFDIDNFVTPCDCQEPIAVCTENPCIAMACPSYPEADCSVDFCGVCKPRWHLNGKEVNCFEERDFCQPNPCENGGVCQQSIWPTEPQLTTCKCPPGFDGHYCQYPALDVCELPVSSGEQCDSRTARVTRWHFEPQSQTCRSFIYSGCGGNSNNFVDQRACENRCKLGACCYRYPTNGNTLIGYDRDGYDMYGYDLGGMSRRGDVRIDVQNKKKKDRYDWQGYDRNGYDKSGYDRLGLDKAGYDKQGFNLTGYSTIGEYDGIIDYDTQGFDSEGFNRAGYTCYGVNRDRQNSYGVNAEYTYKCRSATLTQCQRLESQPGHQVVKFRRGARCGEVRCEEHCGCDYNNVTYRLGETFRSGCQFCTCTLTGSVQCSCSKIFRRKEIRDMSEDELKMYHRAVQSLNKNGYPSTWFQYSQMYAEYRAQALGNAGSLPWHRYFLGLVERRLQEVDCSITIPYYDWTLNAGNQQKAAIWAANKFGGDGSTFEGCVVNHPFKEYYPPYWVPCLKRQFNTSVQLPDAVDFQYALNEPTYERFRLSMEVYMDIFKSWVGGHMDSEYSPYDPLFLSVAAFMDRVWWDWQTEHEDGLYRYPQDLRYVPMMPFRSTPDDVMDSKKDMCVTYWPLSEGAACNVTLPKYGDNSMGYDRHGFNREGYDIEGYNVLGVDKDGKPDERGIYNNNGFDREGFMRNGYDNMGWDRYGFYKDNINANGYGPSGYDRRGYDRYGFDKKGVTPFGFHRNGTQLVNTLPDVFDSYGYNRYGLNKYGFDREGYDVFGFDSLGYDRRRCNKHFLGPMLVIIKRWAEVELEKVDNRTIRIIARICPQVDDRPEWRYTYNWLRRGEQVPLIEGIIGRAQARVNQLAGQDNDPLTEGVWLPVGPDKDLCFVTYYYTECPFGQFPVECTEDLCEQRQCPGYPDAVCRVNRCGGCSYEWYNGVTGALLECSGCVDRRGQQRMEGSSWAASDCETCQCQGGKISCAEIKCPIVTCSHAVKFPGQCCLQCDAGCQYNGILYPNGNTFTSADDKCAECSCEDGSVNCVPVGCPDLGTCSSTTVLEGECCPTCLDCGNRENGEEWMETPCQACACVDGGVECQKIRCIPPDCSHPVVQPGQCCASCDGCSVNGRDMQDEETYMPDQCTECVCRQGNIVCDPVPCPLAACANAITPAGECCPRCDIECEFNRRVYRHGESFISSEDLCSNCTCVNSFIQCNPVTCARMNLPCRQPITVPGDCCPTLCPKCVADGVEYENGAKWTSVDDPCETCVCEEGINSCTRINRCPVECDHGVYRPGECCSQCTDCLYNGLQVRDGRTFVQPGDACQQCTCTQGTVTCEYLGPCPRLPCRVTETPPGACCPQCKRCEYQGRSYSQGDTVSMDKCSTCYCREGEVTCERVACPATKCRYPTEVPGECCPVCLQCEYKGGTYDDGQRFTPLREPCHDCVCQSGEVTCATRASECPVARCTHPITTTRQCCPVCDMGCLYLRKRIRNGQKFVPPGNDNCQVCRCMGGSVTCMNMGCPAVNCNNAVLVKGQCCPVCPMGCSVMGVPYRDGQTFIDFMDRCKVCTCMMGQIQCMTMMSCAPVTCTHPAMRPGNCCPSCTMCDWNNAQYRNGENFNNPANLCEQCTCKDGSITCRSKALACPNKPSCLDPVIDPTTCCPVCESDSQPCVYGGRRYQEGAVVPGASRDTCDTCRCAAGMVDCSREQCQPVTCRHPGRDECCETCDSCFFEGMRFALGEQFPSKYDTCQDCVCQAGSVWCARRECDVPNCQYPVYLPGGCCPECSDCTYQGVLYRDGEDFTSPVRPCEVCHCMKGNVACDTRACPEVNCEHPALDDCCPKCEDCHYKNQTYPNGASFLSKDGCSNCHCRHGNVQCTREPCPRVQCARAYQGRCCLKCPEDLRIECTYNNQVYQDGARFASATDRCSECVCSEGQVTCSRRQCPPATCSHPERTECCLECRNCFYGNQVYQHGERFSDNCETCVCSAGSVQCERPCPPANCVQPLLVTCCPLCDGGSDGGVVSGECVSEGRTYQHGDPVPNNRDPCTECYCEAGSIVCASAVCGPITCRHPVMGQCCPECGDCSIGMKRIADGDQYPDVNDRCSICTCEQTKFSKWPECGDCSIGMKRIADGDQYPHVNDRCSICTCEAGTITCERPECGPVTCSDPAEDMCGCPVCDGGCIYHRQTAGDGDRFEHPLDRCQECICQAGYVECFEKRCRGACSHPADSDGCCPICSSCLYEGQIQIEGTEFASSRNPCQQCLCNGGNVTCTIIDCPRADCDNPVAQPGQCCATCEECTYNGRSYRDGEMFRDASDPCTHCSCLAGRVVCKPVACRDQCSHPVPGGCCPDCDRCLYQGAMYSNGEEFPTDTCTSCICRDGSVTCTRQTCPAITCAHPVSQPGQCCPTCKGPDDCTRERIGDIKRPDPSQPCMYCLCQSDLEWGCHEETCPAVPCPNPVTTPGACCAQCHSCFDVATGREYQDGQVWTHTNNCNNCICKAGAIECAVTVCGPITCNHGERLVNLPGQCCPECEGTRNTDGCYVDGTFKMELEEWRPDACHTCQCVQGEVSCSAQACPAPTCGPQEALTVPPGSCCPICAPKPGVCHVYGDPHYRTFDGRDFHFQGTCRYIMAQDCGAEDFLLEVQHDARGVEGVSWAHNFTLIVSGVQIDILQNHEIRVNRVPVRLPYTQTSDLSIERLDDNILITTSIGIQFLWDGRSYGELTVPGSYKRKMCGLCGNFNGFPQDDLTTRDRQILNSAALFGNSWKTIAQPSGSCSDATDASPCDTAGYRVRQRASSTCEVLRGPKFSACHRVVSMNPYFDSCVYDLCACTDSTACLCDILATYARDCAKAGVRLEWRAADLCPMACDVASGFQFDECGPACDRTCDNWRTPLGDVAENCYKPCVPGCRCTADKVVHQGRCIDPQQCPNHRR